MIDKVIAKYIKIMFIDCTRRKSFESTASLKVNYPRTLYEVYFSISNDSIIGGFIAENSSVFTWWKF